MRRQHVDSCLCSPTEPSRIITQFDDARHDPLTIAGNAIPKHVACKHHKTEIRKTQCAPLGVLVETGASMDDQEARTSIAPCLITSEEPRKRCILITVVYGLRIHDRSPFPAFIEMNFT
jgi:hypothetical protein